MLNVVLFKKPAWFKPEINELKYWIHLVILSTVLLYTIDYFSIYHGMFNTQTIVILVPLLALGDIIAHSLLQLD